MVQYSHAALTLFLVATASGSATTTASAFIPANPLKLALTAPQRYKNSHVANNIHRYSAIPYDDRSSSSSESVPPETQPQQEQGVQFPSTGLFEYPDDEEQISALLAKKEETRAARKLRSKSVYQVSLPIVSRVVRPLDESPDAVRKVNLNGEVSDNEELATLVAKGQQIAIANSVGMSLRQVYSGRRLSELALDVDTLRFQSFLDELQGRLLVDDEMEDNSTRNFESVQVLQNSAINILKDTFDGVIVSSVTQGGLAWREGVRPGDVLVATSATVGSKLWPKSTLDGVRSAISSRKVISQTMDFEFRRLLPNEHDLEKIQNLELSLPRPIGINIEDTDDGYVTITGISDKATATVKNNLSIGDRIISVESSIGGKMWQVDSTEGVISAVTSRLPGQPVRICFERVGNNEELMEDKPSIESNETIPPGAVEGFRQACLQTTSAAEITETKLTSYNNAASSHRMLLSRSRDLLRTYIARNDIAKERAVPAKVADRVIEAVMEASAALDGPTLSLILTAYNVCNKPEKAIATFEEVFKVAGDGSENEVKLKYNGKLVADISALNTYTISALLKSHAVKGDHEAAICVLAAMQDDSELSVGSKRPRSWSGKGDPFNMFPDTRCYNIAISAAAKRGTKEGLRAAEEIFETMPEPSITELQLGKPAKNLVTYNTMIDAYATVGRFQDAYDSFKRLKNSILRPDKVTYTSLIKGSIKNGNLEKALDILDDMKWAGVTPDIVTYNNIIEALCKANRLYEAKDLVNEMERTGVSPDSMTYGLLMNGLLKANKPGPCLTLFASAYSDPKTAALTENVHLYTTAISAAAALRDHERALELVTRMNRAGVKPNKKTLTALMGACIAGGKYDAAVDVFLKIKNPDGYSTLVGIKALCLAGKLDEAMELLSGQRCGQFNLSGKQVMSSFNVLIESALKSGHYAAARNALCALLSSGYIPSKATYSSIIDGLSLLPDIPSASLRSKRGGQAEEQDKKFKFLLFALDSLERRKLILDSALFSSILVLGAQEGGLKRRIASFLAQSRRGTKPKKDVPLETDSLGKKAPEYVKWEDLFDNYSEYKEMIGLTIFLPAVRVSPRDFGRVLAAEQAVTFRGRAR